MSFTLPSVTGWSNFYGPTVNAYQPQYARSVMERRISVELARLSNRAARAAIRALTGVAPGSSKAASYSRVFAPAGLTQSEQLGGLRAIETFSVQTGNTTAADVAYINDLINDQVFNQQPAVYPVDLSGNGGGGKRGY